MLICRYEDIHVILSNSWNYHHDVKAIWKVTATLKNPKMCIIIGRNCDHTTRNSRRVVR